MQKAIVVGSGPAGIGAALALAREGIEVQVLEKQQKPGVQRRGETIRYNERMESLLGPGFFQKQTIHKVNKRRYYSHTCKKYVDRKISTYNLIIAWPRWIEAMVEVAKKEGVEFFFGVEVEKPLEENNVVSGVQTKDGKKWKSDVIFYCAGHSGNLRPKDAAKAIPIYKKLVSNYHGPQDRLEYYFQVDESFPAIGTIFPRGNQDAEVILMFLTDCAVKPVESWDLYNQEIQNFPAKHPVFAERMQGTKVDYEIKTSIPMSGLGKSFALKPGLFAAGDFIGTVQARGGSGIKSSFLIAYDLAQKVAENAKSSIEWSLAKWNEYVANLPEMKELQEMDLKFGLPRRLFFRNITSPFFMDMFWGALSIPMR